MTRRRLSVALVVLVLLVSGVVSAQTPTASSESPQSRSGEVPRQISPSLFVGPQIRDGFADVTAGIRDSILDIKARLGSNGFALAASPEFATIVLTVLGRGIVSRGPIGIDGLIVPYEKPTVSALLRVGTYEMLLQSEGSTWGGAANQIIKDVQAWWTVNRSRFE